MGPVFGTHPIGGEGGWQGLVHIFIYLYIYSHISTHLVFQCTSLLHQTMPGAILGMAADCWLRCHCGAQRVLPAETHLGLPHEIHRGFPMVSCIVCPLKPIQSDGVDELMMKLS